MVRKSSRKNERRIRKKSALRPDVPKRAVTEQLGAAEEPDASRRTVRKPLGVLSCMAEKKVRRGWRCVCAVLAVLLHAAPVALALFGPSVGLPNVLEVNLDAMNLFRERVFREANASQAQNPPLELQPVQVQAQVPTTDIRPTPETRMAGPQPEEQLLRTRIVQKAIARLWENASPEQAGYALVSLNILDDGSIGEFVVNRFSGDESFRTFLFSFLTTLKASYGNQAGPGEAFWLECEFKVASMERKGKS